MVDLRLCLSPGDVVRWWASFEFLRRMWKRGAGDASSFCSEASSNTRVGRTSDVSRADGLLHDHRF